MMGETKADNISIGEKVENQNTHMAGGIVKWYSHLEDSLAVPPRVKHRAYCMS